MAPFFRETVDFTAEIRYEYSSFDYELKLRIAGYWDEGAIISDEWHRLFRLANEWSFKPVNMIYANQLIVLLEALYQNHGRFGFSEKTRMSTVATVQVENFICPIASGDKNIDTERYIHVEMTFAMAVDPNKNDNSELEYNIIDAILKDKEPRLNREERILYVREWYEGNLKR